MTASGTDVGGLQKPSEASLPGQVIDASVTQVHTRGLTGRPSATGRQRINALDGLRGVALLIVT